jgi:CRP-like cAMP-binding protein
MASVNLETLARLSIFKKLSPTTTGEIARCLSVLAVNAGVCLYQQGDPPCGLFVLEAGHVILYRQSKTKSQILSILKAEDCFGGESLSNEGPCPYTAKAISPVQALYIAPDMLQQLLASHNDLLVVFLELVSSRLRQLTTLVHQLAFHGVASRLAAVLLALAEGESESMQDGIRVPRVLSQQDLAAMTGTAREVVYRTLKQFESAGLLRQTRTHYVITDFERLIAVAEEESR